MMKQILLSGVALTALSTLAFAQTGPSTPASPGASAPVMGAPATPGVTTPQKDKNAPLFTNYKGADILGPDGKSVGSIADVIVDGQGAVQKLAISYGGVLGIGSTVKADNVSTLPALQDGKVKLDLTEASLKALPTYDAKASAKAGANSDEGRASTSSATPAPSNTTPGGSMSANAPTQPNGSMAAQPPASGTNGADSKYNLSNNNAPGKAPDAAGGSAGSGSSAMNSDTSGSMGASAPAATGWWPVSSIVGADIHQGDKTAAIDDAVFANGHISEVVVNDGSAIGLGKGEQHVAFNQLAITGTPDDPKIMLQSAGAAGGSSTSAPSMAPTGNAPMSAPSGGGAPHQ